MMAFFLLMWLLGSTTKGDLQGIADYFRTPLKVSLSGGSGSGDATSAIRAGGRDLTRSDDMQMRRGEMPEQKRRFNIREAQGEVTRHEALRFKALKGKIDQLIDASPFLREYRDQLLIDITSEGLRIQIVDEKSRPMFDLGSAHLKPYAREILLSLCKPLNEVSNGITLTGHTDAKPFLSGERGYSNWELSADRANSSRRVLIEGGIENGKIKRVVGMASVVLFDPADANSPSNRRIAIIVLNSQAEESLRKASGTLAASKAEPVTKEALDAAAR